MALPIEVDQLLSKKRYRKLRRKNLRAWKKREKVARHRVQLRVNFGERSKIIRMLAESLNTAVSAPRARYTVTVPKVFSIIEEPTRAISIIQSFAKALRTNRVRSVQIDQAQLETYDLAASALLDIVASEAALEARQHGISLNFSGRYPTIPSVQRFIRSTGIVKHLNVKHELVKGDESSRLRVFDKRNRHYYQQRDPTKADVKEKTIAGFVDHFNACLRDHRRVLTAESRLKLCDYMSEILCNAEDHPGFVDWTVLGYLDNFLEVPICEIAIFNFGKSIAETLRALPEDHYTRKQVDKYIILHHGQSFFGANWRTSDLLTLIALQGHVSSKNENKEDTRGQGTCDLIDFFQRVHEECAQDSPVKAKMAIVSGGTYILFDGTYKMKRSGDRNRVIAFNPTNSLYAKPDSKFVKSLGNLRFPGTIISIRFPLSVTSTVALGEQQ